MKAKCRTPEAKRITRATLLSVVFCSAAASPAFAQQPPNRLVFISVNAVARTTTRTLSDAVTFNTPFSVGGREPGSASSTYEVPGGTMFDGGVVVRVWQGLSAGVAISAFSSRNDFNITAQMPHPFFFNQMRTIEGTVNSRHAETAVHVMAAYTIPITPRVSLMVSAGPSHFSVEQKLVRGVTATELYPFDTAQFGTADLQVFNTGAWGFNAGADVSWMFTRGFGAGGLLRYAQATMKMNPTGRAPVSMDAGGLQVGGGVRVSF